MATSVQETSDVASCPRISPNLMVAAIDFGTAFSGYAFSMRGDFENDPLRISANQWKSGLMISDKTPTTVLLNSAEECVAFGYEAEEMYTRLTEEEKHTDYYYFRRFKMKLFERQSRLTKEMVIEDINGKPLPAVDVFAHAIDYLRKRMLDQLENRTSGTIKHDEIRWVLTVPAIWDDPAKQFMRDAAEKANIRGDCLTIALEPEAASIFCKHLPIERITTVGVDTFDVFHPGSRYLVLDAGGGTVDITVHEIQSNGKIKELHRASGGAWGGIFVDQAFHGFLAEIIGENELEDYKRHNLADYMDLFMDFELKKRKVTKSDTDQMKEITMKIPPSLIKCTDFETLTKNHCFCEKIQLTKGKLRIRMHFFSDFFSRVCAKIVRHVKEVLKSPAAKGTNTILMVGGFSESIFLQEKIKEDLKDYRIVIPHEAGLAVLRGAVLYGHDPNIISQRVAKFTYGVETNTRFNSSSHPMIKYTIIDGTEYCTNVFSKHITKGDTLTVNKAQDEQTYYPVKANQTSILFRVYYSTDNDPTYTDDPGCTYLGSMDVKIPDTKGGKNRKVLVRFIFGGTEIKVEGKNDQTGEITNVQFNFFDDEPSTPNCSNEIQLLRDIK